MGEDEVGGVDGDFVGGGGDPLDEVVGGLAIDAGGLLLPDDGGPLLCAETLAARHATAMRMARSKPRHCSLADHDGFLYCFMSISTSSYHHKSKNIRRKL